MVQATASGMSLVQATTAVVWVEVAWDHYNILIYTTYVSDVSKFFKIIPLNVWLLIHFHDQLTADSLVTKKLPRTNFAALELNIYCTQKVTDMQNCSSSGCRFYVKNWAASLKFYSRLPFFICDKIKDFAVFYAYHK